MRARLSGLHKATKRLSGGRVAVYAYAYRGGDLIARAEGRDLASANAAMERELGQRSTLDRLEKARQPVRRSDDKAFIRGLIYAFKASPEWTKLGKASQTAYAHYLKSFDAEFGDWKVALFDRLESKADLLDWRDEWADRPRAADYAMQTVGRLFKWARGRGLTQAKPTEDVPRLYAADRSDIIWSDDQIADFCAAASKEVGWSLRMAAETGLRLGDLVSLTWSSIGSEGIVWRTSKKNRQAVIPLTAGMRALLKEIPRLSPIVLTNTRGRPWTVDGLKTMIRDAKKDAGLVGLHFHDVRGTAATRIYIAGCPKADIALIMAWSEADVDALLTKYVSGDAVALDLLSRMNQKRAAQTGDKPGLSDNG